METRPDLKLDQWLNDTVLDSDLSAEDRKHRMINWEKALFARYCHDIFA